MLVPEALSEQHLHQLAYFDAEFSSYGEYRVENWRQSYIDRIFSGLGVLDGNSPYLDVGVGGSGDHDRGGATRRGSGRLRSVSERRARGSRFVREQGVAGMVVVASRRAERFLFRTRRSGSASAVAVLEHLDDDAARRGGAGAGAAARRDGLADGAALVPLHAPASLAGLLVARSPDRAQAALRRAADSCGLRAPFGLEHVRPRYSGHFTKLVQVALNEVGPEHAGLRFSRLVAIRAARPARRRAPPGAPCTSAPSFGAPTRRGGYRGSSVPAPEIQPVAQPVGVRALLARVRSSQGIRAGAMLAAATLVLNGGTTSTTSRASATWDRASTETSRRCSPSSRSCPSHWAASRASWRAKSHSCRRAE